MKKHIDILLEEFETDDDLLKILPSVSAQVVKDVNEHLSERSKPQLPESAAKNLEEQGRRPQIFRSVLGSQIRVGIVNRNFS